MPILTGNEQAPVENTSHFVGNSIGDTLANFAAFGAGSVVSAVTGTADSLLSVGSQLLGGDNVDWASQYNQEILDVVGLGDSYGNVKPAAEFGGFALSMLAGGLVGVKAAQGLANVTGLSSMAAKYTKTGEAAAGLSELASLRAPVFRKALIVDAANQAMQGASAYEKAVPKGKLLIAAIMEGAVDTAAFEIGAWSTTNQFTDYNPEKLAPVQALASNFQNNAMFIALGVPLTAGFLYKESTGAARKLLNQGQQRANSLVAQNLELAKVLDNPTVDLGAKLSAANRDIQGLEQSAVTASNSLGDSAGIITDVNIGEAAGKYRSVIEVQKRELLVKNTQAASHEDAVYIADHYRNHSNKLSAELPSGESVLNSGLEYDGAVHGLSKISTLDAADAFVPNKVASYADSLALGSSSQTAEQMGELAKYQMQADGNLSYLKAAPLMPGMQAEVIIHTDYSKMHPQLQAIAFDRELNSLAARDILQLADSAEGIVKVGGLNGAPGKVVKGVLTRAANFMKELDPEYRALADMQESSKKLEKAHKQAAQVAGKNKLSPEDLDTVLGSLYSTMSTVKGSIKSAFLDKDISKVVEAFKSQEGAGVESMIDLQAKLAKYVQEEANRLMEPSELFGRVLSAQREKWPALIELDPQVANLLKSNDLLETHFSRTRSSIRNLNTNSLIVGGGVRQVASDFGKLSYEAGKGGIRVLAGGKVQATVIEDFTSWTELFAMNNSVEASAQYAYAEANSKLLFSKYLQDPDAVLSQFNLPHLDAVHKELALMQEREAATALNRIEIEGFSGNSLTDLSKFIKERKEEAVNWILDEAPKQSKTIEDLRWHRDNWTVDNISKYTGTGEKLLDQPHPMLDSFSDPRTADFGYWNSPHHVKEWRSVGKLKEDAASAKAMIDAQLAAAQQARALGISQVEATAKFANLVQDMPTAESAAAIVETATTTGGAGLASFSFADSPLGKFVVQIGEKINKYKTTLDTTRREGLRGAWRNIESTGNKAEAFAIIQKVQADRFAGIEYSLQTIQQIGGEAKHYLVNNSIKLDEAVAIRADLAKSIEEVGAIPVSGDVHAFLNEFQQGLNDRIASANPLRQVAGKASFKGNDSLYFPPPDITSHPFVNFLMIKKGIHEGGGVERQMIFGADEANLQNNIREALNQLEAEGRSVQVLDREQIKRYVKSAGGDAWDYTMDFGDRYAKVDKQARGILQGIQPKFDNKLIEDMIDWDIRQHVNVMRDYMKEKYINVFEGLDKFDTLSRSAAASKVGNDVVAMSPFKKAAAEALNLPGDTADWWHQIGETLDKTLSKGAYALNTAAAGIWKRGLDSDIALEQANAAISKYNLRLPYDSVEGMLNAHFRMDAGFGTTVMRKFNTIAATLQLGLDAANNIVQVVSAPIRLMPMLQSLQREALEGSMQKNALSELTAVAVPGTNHHMITPIKAMQQAVMDYFTPEGKQFLQSAMDQGILKEGSLLRQHQEVLQDFSTLPSTGVVQAVEDKISRSAEFLSKWMGTNKAETFQRYVTARSAYLVAEAAHVSGLLPKDQIWMNVYDAVRKLHGTSVAAARPEMFKGVLGSGMMLFQSYQFQMIQQLMRSVGAGARGEAATLVGAQALIFGGQSLPGFNFFNEQNAKANHFTKDLYSATYKTFGEDVGNFLIYGMASAPLAPFGIKDGIALYNRGDTNPRFATVIPTSPQDFPAINMAIKAVSATMDTAGKIAQTGAIGQSIAEGIVLSGLNRPSKMLLQQKFVGGELSSKGNVLAPVSQDFWAWNTFAHALGARTMNEAIVRDAMYRNDSYKTMQMEQLNDLGSTVKTAIRGSALDQTTMESFAESYVKAKGDLKGYNKWMQTQAMSATPTALDQIYRHTQSPKYQNLMQRLGANQESYLQEQLRIASSANTMEVTSPDVQQVPETSLSVDSTGWTHEY